MILDMLSAADRYAALHPGFLAAFEWLRTAKIMDMPKGKQAIDGERLMVVIGRDMGVGRSEARLESHRRYIDIQYVAAGEEEMGWRPLAECRQPVGEFDASRDIVFYTDPPATWYRAPVGSFSIFYPQDPHAPLAGQGQLVKAVMKVAVVW